MSTTRRRPTSTDVARVAGVSRATVSYVLNNTSNQRISEATRLRVLAAATELGYSPSLVGRALVSGHSDLVLFTLPDAPVGELSLRLIDVLTTALEARGLNLIVHHRTGTGNVGRLASTLAVRGVVSLFPPPAEEALALERSGVPLIVPSLRDGEHRHCAATLASELSAAQQAERLRELGHRHLAVVLPTDPRLDLFAEPRRVGVASHCRIHNLPEPVEVRVPGHADGVVGAMAELRHEHPEVTGVCAYNDDVGMAVLHALRMLGVDVPGEMALIGNDNTSICEFTVPPMSSIGIELDPVVEYFVGLTMAEIDGTEAPEPPGSAIHFVQRCTT